MLWGITIDPLRPCKYIAEGDIHVSFAVLDCRLGGYSKQLLHLIVKQKDHERLLCTFVVGYMFHQDLNLKLSAGEQVTFIIDGPNKVHLNGYTSGNLCSETLMETSIVDESEPPAKVPLNDFASDILCDEAIAVEINAAVDTIENEERDDDQSESGGAPEEDFVMEDGSKSAEDILEDDPADKAGDEDEEAGADENPESPEVNEVEEERMAEAETQPVNDIEDNITTQNVPPITDYNNQNEDNSSQEYDAESDGSQDLEICEKSLLPSDKNEDKDIENSPSSQDYNNENEKQSFQEYDAECDGSRDLEICEKSVPSSDEREDNDSENSPYPEDTLLQEEQPSVSTNTELQATEESIDSHGSLSNLTCKQEELSDSYPKPSGKVSLYPDVIILSSDDEVTDKMKTRHPREKNLDVKKKGKKKKSHKAHHKSSESFDRNDTHNMESCYSSTSYDAGTSIRKERHKGSFDEKNITDEDQDVTILKFKSAPSTKNLKISKRSKSLTSMVMCISCGGPISNHRSGRIIPLCSLCTSPKRRRKLSLDSTSEKQVKKAMKHSKKAKLTHKTPMSHVGVTLHLCRYCSRTFKGKSQKRFHEKSHFPQLIYGCRYCEQRFDSSISRQKHELYHLAKKISPLDEL